MLDIGWTEMFVVAVVAIIVIGPKELPAALRTAGRWARKVRGAAREFQSSIDDMVNQAELDEIRKSANEVRNFSATQYISDSVDPTGPTAAGPTVANQAAGNGSGTAASPATENSMMPPGGPETAETASTSASGSSDTPKERETNTSGP